VFGSRQRPYSQAIMLASNGRAVTINGYCSCPVGDIMRRLQGHVVLNPDQALTVALWIMMAWAHAGRSTAQS
jgi:hypothetical protein